MSVMFALCLSAGIVAISAQGKAARADGAVAAPLHQQLITYQLYAGGIHAVEAVLDMQYQTQDRYGLQLDAYTKGFLGRLVPWKGRFESHGWRLKNKDMPELHRSTTTWRNEVEVKSYNYGKDGSFKGLEITEDGRDKSPREIDDELVQGTTDALTAALTMLQDVAAGHTCESSSEVFDGKRRYKMVFREAAQEYLKKSRYNAYEGPSIMCEVEVVPVAGAWHSKPRGWASIQEQGREKGSLPTIWIAQIDEEGPAVPVKMRIKTDYGTLFMHMSDYVNGDKKLARK